MPAGPAPRTAGQGKEPAGKSCLAIIRTHEYGPAERELAAYLERYFGADMRFVFNLRAGQPENVPDPFLTIGDQDVTRLGLFVHPAWGWRCGDYTLYRAREVLPGNRYYLMIEPDVRLTYADPAELFDRLAASDADLLAFHVRQLPREGDYTRNLLPAWRDVWSCELPVARVSQRLVDMALRARQEMTGAYCGTARVHWPNDELTLASTARAAGLKMADLRDFLGAEAFDGSFGNKYRRVFHREEVVRGGKPGHIYHPVYPHDRFVRFLEDCAARRPGKAAAILARLQTVLTPAQITEFGTVRDLIDAGRGKSGTGDTGKTRD